MKTMKRLKMAIAALMLTTVAMIAAGCTKPDDLNNNGGNNGGGDNGGGDNEEPTTTVSVTLKAPQNVKHTTALLGAVANVPEGEDIGQFAICWGTEENPVTGSGNTIYYYNVPSFDTLVFGFQPGTTYHVRAFLRAGSGDYYSEDKTFTTHDVTDMSLYDSIGGYPYVDLGLPSGLKWAVYNVGTNSPAGRGSYFAWGETEEKSDYTWYTYKYGNYYDDVLSKYNDEDNLTTLQSIDDPVSMNWEGGWRTPTKDEFEEFTQHYYKIGGATVNDVEIWIFTFPNGNSIFLPKCGYKSGTGTGPEGIYATSSVGTSNRWYNIVFKFYMTALQGTGREFGFPYRGVHSSL